MFDFMTRLAQLRDAIRTGAGRLDDVLEKAEALLAEARGVLQDVEAGRVFAPSPQTEAELNAIEADLRSIAEDRGTLPAAASATPAGAVPPGLWVALAQLALELIRLRRERRGQ